MRLKKYLKVICIAVLVAFLVFVLNNDVLAAINTEYSGTDPVPNTKLDESFSNSSLLGLIARLIYALGRFFEWILGTIFKLLTGFSDFPWADKIVFNAVPLLDVNFINPNGQSFVGQPAIQAVLKNIYATILTLATAFFGITVLITAIRLVISTIASEKAKYKKAIVDWLIGFVMLFCTHYAISFIFYLNEQLVIVASQIVDEQLKGANKEAIAGVQANYLIDELISHVRQIKATYNNIPVADLIDQNRNIVSTWMFACTSEDTSKGVQEAIQKEAKWWTWGNDVAVDEKTQYEQLGMIIYWARNSKITASELGQIKVVPYLVESVLAPGVSEKVQLDKTCLQACYNGVSSEFSYEDIDNKIAELEENGTDLTGCNDNDQAACVYLCGGTCSDVDHDTTNDGVQTQETQSAELDPNSDSLLADQAISTYDLARIFGEQYNEFMTILTENKGNNRFRQANVSYNNNKPYINGNKAKEIQEWKDMHVGANYWILSPGIKKVYPQYSPMTTDSGSRFFWSELLDDLTLLKSASHTENGDDVSGGSKRLIADLAAYFRYNSYSKELRSTNKTGVTTGDNIEIENMIMYAILVVQSLILFISYVKRLFYVILLAMMAPVVVVFDFFQKFGK